MSDFVKNPQQDTKDPKVLVDGLQAGTYQFQLVVEDASGVRSTPAVVLVRVGKPLIIPTVVKEIP